MVLVVCKFVGTHNLLIHDSLNTDTVFTWLDAMTITLVSKTNLVDQTQPPFNTGK